MSLKIFLAAEKYNMLSFGDKIVIGLSGGADSVCLTHLLYSLREKYNLTLLAAHINHGIRGDEALRDENFCREFCRNLNIPLTVYSFNIPYECKETGESEEECGRRIRYECFNKLAGNNSKIATAHNLDDSAETILLNIVRGTGNKGLCGIPPVRGNIIRPLILSSRQDIEEYCRENSLSFVTDSTNLQNEYKRNIIRHSVMPVLEEMNPSILTSFSRLIENSTDDEAFLSESAEKEYLNIKTESGISSEKLQNMPRALRRRVIALFLKDNNIDFSFVNINDIEKILTDSKEISLPRGKVIRQKDGILTFDAKKNDKSPFFIEFDIKDGFVVYPYGKLKIQALSQKDLQNLNKELLDNAVDCDKINNTLILRSRAEGDSFTSAVRNNTKTVKKLFNESKIPTDERACIPIIADGDEVVWIKGFGTSKRFRADKNSSKAIIII